MTQPTPKSNDGPAIWDLVIADMKQPAWPRPWPDPTLHPLIIADMRERDLVGQVHYGVRLQAHNGRDALRDAYEELLDAAVFQKQAIVEGAPIGILYGRTLDLACEIRRLIYVRDGR